MREKTRSRAVGRPLKGDQKRVRASFTLYPPHFRWLQTEAEARGKTRSELLDEIIGGVTPRQSKVQIPIPQEELNRFCKAHHIRRLALFGSVLTRDFGPASDLDFLVEFEPSQTPGLFEMVKMESELSRIFGGRKIDLKTPQELSRYFRQDVLQGSEVLYAT